ncbi:MAG: hypothetical protein RR348_01885 [Clostridia bacterium]
MSVDKVANAVGCGADAMRDIVALSGIGEGLADELEMSVCVTIGSPLTELVVDCSFSCLRDLP